MKKYLGTWFARVTHEGEHCGVENGMFKFLGAVAGLAAVLAGAPVQAALVYDSITGASIGNGNFATLTQANFVGSPLGDSFSVSGAVHINSVKLALWDATAATDKGSVSGYWPTHKWMILLTCFA